MRIFGTHTSYRKVLRITLLTAASSLAVNSAHAQSINDDDLYNRVVKLADKIEARDLVIEGSKPAPSSLASAIPAKKIEASRISLYDVLFTGDRALITSEFEQHKKLVEMHGTQRDKDVLSLFTKFLKQFSPDKATTDYSVILHDIQSYFNHPDWFVGVQAYALKCTLEAIATRRIDGLESAKKALSLIPDDVDPYSHEARILITDIIVLMNNLQHNTSLAVQNTERLIQLKIEAGQSVDGIELLNNLMYSFGVSRDHKTNLKIAETLKRLESIHSSTTLGLTDMRLARTYAEIGDFVATEKYAKQALETTNIEAIKTRSKLLVAISRAGQNDPVDARKILAELGPSSRHEKSHYLYAEALIAQAENRPIDATKLFNKRLDLNVQKILISNNKDATALVASLESSRARQEERENSLIREAELKAQKLAEQEKVNRLLMAMLAIIFAALVGALFFARYRDKTSKLLAIKTKEAESADRLKTEFLGMVSHELRTPLNGIIGIADFLTHRHDDPDVRAKSNIILQSGNVLFKLVESIIDMSRLDGGKLNLYQDPTSLDAPLRKTVESWVETARDKGIKYTYFVGDGIEPEVLCDQKRILQCINSLIDNAIKFTDDGRVHVHITQESHQDGVMHLQAIIADTGMGISDDVQAKLFKPFLQADSSMTRKFNGSGLNLAITRSLARMMDGDVTLNSRTGRGSEFKFTAALPNAPAGITSSEVRTATQAVKEDIEKAEKTDSDVLDLVTLAPHMFTAPLAQGDAGSNPAPLEKTEIMSKSVEAQPRQLPRLTTEPNDLNGLKVLIVEDVPANQDVLKLLLAPQGCLCLTADNGEQALEVLKNHPVDIILMDLRMPGMDGIETTHVIRNTNTGYQDIPIIAVTADANSHTNAECMAAGANLFLTKPVMKTELLDAIIFLRQEQRNQQPATRIA